MAFPTIAATNTSAESGGTTSHTISLPSGISAGHLLLVFFATDGDNTISDWDGFIEIFNKSNGISNSLSVAYKIATGSEGATITITSTSSEPSAHGSYRITGWESDSPPEVSAGVNGSSATPDPDSLDVSWAQDDTLWIAIEGCDRRTTDAFPANYGLSQLASNGAAGSQGCSCGVAGRNLNADPENPSTFTIALSDQWVACTVGVRPDQAPPPPAKGVNEKMINRLINAHINDRIN